MKKYNWIYQMRGMAIIAVVICYQQHLLHESEWIQLLTLYSVTTFIFCAGLTKTISYNKSKITSIALWQMQKLFPLLCSYLIATMAYITIDHIWSGIEIEVLWSDLLQFSASPPFYFLLYYFSLTLISPILYMIIMKICNSSKMYITVLKLLFFLVGLFIIGYAMIDKVNFLGQNYLFVYGSGMLLGKWVLQENTNVWNKKSRIICSMVFG